MAPSMGLLQYKEIWIYSEKLHSRKLDHLGEDLELLAVSSLVQSSDYLPQILFVHIYMTEPLVYAFMPF